MNSKPDFAQLASGHRLAYAEHGDRSGSAVVFLHGYSDSHRSFDRLIPHLTPAFRAIAVSQRGHGSSDKPEDGFTIADFAEDLIELLDALAVERAVVVGHSMGAAVALQAAITSPARIAGIVLINGFAHFRGNPAVEEVAGAIAAMDDEVPIEFIREFQESTVASRVPDDFLAMVVGESLKCPTRVWKAAAEGMLEFEPLVAASRCQIPALQVYGICDVFVPGSDQTELHDAFPCSRLITLVEAGHSPHWEFPEATAEYIARFMIEFRLADGPVKGGALELQY